MSKIEELRADRELLLEFFLTFACFEYALKVKGFAIGDEERVRPDWTKYATSIRNEFDKNTNENLLNASNYLLDDPPKKQVLIPNGPAWRTEQINERLSDIENLLRFIRIVRNNLFHGGKFNVDVHEHTERTELLLRSCLIILNTCLVLSPDVKEAFDNAVI